MSFRVNPWAVEAMGAMMERTCDAAQLFYANALSGADNVDEGMLLNTVFEALDKYQALAEFNLQAGWHLAGTCSEALRKAAKYYTDADERSAAALDATFPGPVQPPHTFNMHYHSPGNTFVDTYDAAEDPRKPGTDYGGTATPTEDTLKVGDGWFVLEITSTVNDILGKVSVAGHIRDLLKHVTGKDWIEVVTTYISGDWVELMRQGMALRDVAVAYGRINANVMRGWSDLGPLWDGNAAGTARDWLWDYATNASMFAGFCDQAGVAVQNFARAAYHGLQAVDIAVDMLIDTLVELMIRAPGSADILGGILAAVRGTVNVPELLAGVAAGISGVSDALDLLEAAVNAFKGVAAFKTAEESVYTMTWPALEYSHPAVS